MSASPDQPTEQAAHGWRRPHAHMLLRAVSAAEWIAADCREDGDLKTASYFDSVAADLRSVAHSQGIRC